MEHEFKRGEQVFVRAKTNFLKVVEEQGKVKILSEYKGVHEPVKVECLKNNEHKWITTPHQIMQKGCPFCSNKRIEKGINSLGDYRPDLIKYFKNQEEAYKISLKTGQKRTLKCPDCGYEVEKEVKFLANNGFSCPRCGDNISRPNKFVKEFLLQAKKLEIVQEIDFEWNPCKDGSYWCDGFFIYNGKSYVIEMQGIQHKKGWQGHEKITKSYIQELDEKKRNILKQLNITEIEIDCDKTDFNYIYKNFTSNIILQSIFNFDLFDWDLIKYSLDKNIKKQICEDFDLDLNVTAQDLSKKYGIFITTIIRYLKAGDYFGWCDFEDNKYRARDTSRKERKFSIGQNRIVLYKNGAFVDYFQTANLASKYVKELTGSGFNITKDLQAKRIRKDGYQIIKDIDLTIEQLQELENFQKDKQDKHKLKAKMNLLKI